MVGNMVGMRSVTWSVCGWTVVGNMVVIYGEYGVGKEIGMWSVCGQDGVGIWWVCGRYAVSM